MNIQATAISVLILFISPALGSYQTVSFWQYNVSLDFGGQQVMVDPQPGSSDLYSTFPDVDHGTLSGLEGFLATGTGRVPRGFGKQTCYGGLITLPGGAVSRRDFAVFGHFQNETMSEQFVRSAMVEYAGQLTRIS